jgi:hypothetical protein
MEAPVDGARRGTELVLHSGNWAVGFVFAGILFQLALFFFGGTSIRLPLRIGSYATSLGILFLLPGRGSFLPAARWAWAAVLILTIQCLNPAGDTLLSRVAQAFLYTSVLAPLIWVGRLRIDQRTFKIVVLSLWGFYTASSVFGVLQIEIPGRFDGAVSANYDEQSLIPNTFTLADGRKILRPKGLSDNPGGAGTAGLYTIILGMGLLISRGRVATKVLAVAGMGCGLFCIYICQGRTTLIIVGLAFLLVMVALIRRGATAMAVVLGYFAAAVIIFGTSAAFLIGGQSVVDRFATLVASDAGTVYQTNRGQFLDELVSYDIINYPLGAGLGHWGMMKSYFGDSSKGLWAEMQWQALAYDGGIPLILAYLAIFGILIRSTWKLSVRIRENELTYWAIVIFAFNCASLCASFSYPLMSIQTGMDLTLLNATLAAAVIAEVGSDAALGRAGRRSKP